MGIRVSGTGIVSTPVTSPAATTPGGVVAARAALAALAQLDPALAVEVARSVLADLNRETTVERGRPPWPGPRRAVSPESRPGRRLVLLEPGETFTVPAGLLGDETVVIQAVRSLTAPPAPARMVPVVADAEGCDMRPDPRDVRTAAELVAALHEFHEWGGEPSLSEMAARARQLASRSSIYRAMHSQALPSLKAVVAIVAGCGGGEEDQRRFASAWRRARSGRHPAVPALRTIPASRAS